MVTTFDWKHYISRKFLFSASILVCGLIKAMMAATPEMAAVGFGAALATTGVYVWGNIKAAAVNGEG